VTDLKVFLDDVRLHDWAPGLAANATYFKGEVPRERHHLPRFIDEFVMGQIDHQANLARLPDLTTQTAIVILIETGLRSVDALRLPFDPITVDEAGAPYLIFVNHKLLREAIIPISERLTLQIRRQQRDLVERFGAPRPPYLLPAPRANAGGQRPLTWGTLSRRLDRWMRNCDIRDATRLPVRVTAHQFRHTLGTRMINNNVSMPAVQRMLDHDSPEMTARYARIKDQTLRREWERYQQRINVRGEGHPPRPRRADQRRRLGQGEPRARQADAAQRLLRPAVASDLPAPQRLPDLRQLPDHGRVPAGASRPATAHGRADRGGPDSGLRAPRRDERAGAAEPGPHHRGPRRAAHPPQARRR